MTTNMRDTFATDLRDLRFYMLDATEEEIANQFVTRGWVKVPDRDTLIAQVNEELAQHLPYWPTAVVIHAVDAMLKKVN